MSKVLLRRILLLLGVIGLVVVVCFVGVRVWAELSETAATKRGASGPLPVEVSVIERGRIEERLRIAGSLLAAEEFSLAAELSARLEQLQVHVGDPVQRGVVLARLDAQRFAQQVKESEALLQIAEAELLQARSQVEIKKRHADRYQQLLQRGIATEAEADEASAAHISAVTQIAVAEARQAQAQAELETARLDLDKTEIKAQWDGDDKRRVVGDRWVDAGEQLQAGQNIISIIQINPLKAEMFVTEAHYGKITVGQHVEIAVDSWPQEKFSASVVRIAPRFNPDSRQARVELSVSNTDGRLKPGMFMRAEMLISAADDVLLIPETALISRGGQASIFIVSEDMSAKQVNVRIGIRDHGMLQISAEDESVALEGARVITLGQHLLTDANPVRIAAE